MRVLIITYSLLKLRVAIPVWVLFLVAFMEDLDCKVTVVRKVADIVRNKTVEDLLLVRYYRYRLG